MANGTSSPGPRRRFAGPVLLILIGVLFLIWNLGYHLPLGRWFAMYWPALIILWGLLKLLEYVQARREGVPPPGIGAGGVFLLIVLILCGVTANRMLNVNWAGLRDQVDWGDNDFAGLFGNSYTYSDTLDHAFPAGSALNIVCPRGDVVVHAGADNQIKVVAHKKVYASDQGAADQIQAASKPTLTADGTAFTLLTSDRDRVVSDLEIYLPKQAVLRIDARHGDVNVSDRVGDLQVSSAHGDVSVVNLTGNATLSMRAGSVTANHVTGDLTVNGRVNDSNVTDIGGSASFSGDFFGDMHVAKVAKSVRFSSSRTDLEMQKLDGEMTMGGGDFSANSFSGPFKLSSRSKDVRLQDFSGDVHIDDTNAQISLTPGRLPLGNIDVTNQRGKIYLELPAKAGFQLDAETTRGEITSDFEVGGVRTSGNQSRASAVVGGGGPNLKLSCDRGDIEIHKAS